MMQSIYAVASNKVCADWVDKYQELDKVFSIPLFVDKITYESDVPVDEDEFFYLLGVEQGQFVSAIQLRQACFYLEQKKIFSKIYIKVSGDSSKQLHFSLKGNKRLQEIKISGVLFGKDLYRRLYQIDVGEKFEIKKHNYSKVSILDSLYSRGYLGATLTDDIYIDPKTKLVAVTLTISTGDCYKISEIDCFIQEGKGLLNKSDKLYLDVYKHLSDSLLKSKYLKNTLVAEAKLLKKHLITLGYPFAQIRFDTLIDKQNKKLKLFFNISLQQEQSYNFVGNKYFSSASLLDFIMIPGDPVWNLPVSLVAKDLTDHYKNHGFWDVVIKTSEEPHIFKFDINEGARSAIKSITIEGAESFESKFLINKFFKKLLQKKYFTKKLLSAALVNLTNYFVEAGFWDFQILDNTYKKIGKSLANYELVLFVDEGKRRYLKTSAVDRYKDICLPFSKSKRCLPFKSHYLQKQKAWLQNHFASQGYCNATIVPKVEDVNGSVAVTWSVKLGSPLKMGKVILQGNGKFKFKRLLHEFECREGDIWDKEKLENISSRLKSYDAFDSVHTSLASEIDPLGHKPIILKLKTDGNLEFRTRLGLQKVSKNFAFKSGTTHKVGGSTVWKNPTKCGDQIRIDVDLTKFYREVVMQYKMPCYLGVPMQLSTKVYLNKYDQPLFIGSKKRLYQVLQQGALIDLSRKGKKFNFGISTGIEGVQVDSISKEYAAAINFSDSLLAKKVPFFFLSPTVILDLVDDKLNPRKGLLTVASVKGMFAIGKEQNYFWKFLLEQSFFIPMPGHMTFATRIRFGHIITNNFDVIMPIERFYLGGANSLRSFNPDFAPPLGEVIDDDGKSIFVPQGGKSMINVNLELRFPLYGNVKGVVFQDIGTLLKKGTGLGEGELLSATGVGLRYITPLGPLRFDIGWRQRRFVGDSSLAWFLTIGHAF